MNNYTENDTFGFGIEQENKYENEDMFNTEVYSPELNSLSQSSIENDITSINDISDNSNNDSSNDYVEAFDLGVFDTNLGETSIDNEYNASNNNSFITPYSNDILEEAKEDTLNNDEVSINEESNNVELNQEVQNFNPEENGENSEVEVLIENDNSFDKRTEELANEINSDTNKIQMSESDLSSLTTFSEDKVETTNIKDLFDRVGINVKEASDVFKRNTEMKEKLDTRFEELKKLQLDVARKKEEQYAEINSYKEEVLSKLTEKKDEIERRLNKLKEFQSSLEKEKEEFEQYRKKEKEEIERVQKEVQEAYDSRREELNHIEDVLRRQKDLLDEERSQLSLDKIQYESDKNELANNLLKFNEIVDSFTNGIDKLDKE